MNSVRVADSVALSVADLNPPLTCTEPVVGAASRREVLILTPEFFFKFSVKKYNLTKSLT